MITDQYGNITEQDTKQCVHCGCHWVIQPGSGKLRGFCMKCKEVTCGKPQCDPCNPYKRWQE